MIQKIVSQEDTQNNLMELTKENQAKLEALNEERDRLKARVEEVRQGGEMDERETGEKGERERERVACS